MSNGSGPIDFPQNPTQGQLFVAPTGVVYQWNGTSWLVGYFDSTTQQLSVVGDILDQVRTLLQDTDSSSGQYRYSTDSLVTALNQAVMDMFRLRPDLFLEQGFVIPVFSTGQPNQVLGIEEQYVVPLVYYVVGLAQLRDDEQNQDQRAAALLKSFATPLLTMSA